MSRKSLAVLTGLALSFSSGLGAAQAQSIPEEIVDALNKVWGVHPGFRANHAKGIVTEGAFKASSEAAGLSRAMLFNGTTIPATVRFSDATGIPNVNDGGAA